MKKKYIHNYVYFLGKISSSTPWRNRLWGFLTSTGDPRVRWRGWRLTRRSSRVIELCFLVWQLKKIFKLYVIANKINRSAAKRQHIYIWFGYWFLETSCGKSIKLLLSNYYQRPFLWEETMLRIDHFRNQNLNSNIIVMQNLSIYADIGKAVCSIKSIYQYQQQM